MHHPLASWLSALFTSVITYSVVRSISDTEVAFSSIFQQILVKVLNLDKDANPGTFVLKFTD
ncbi:hypothetical protein EG339_02060 [Chryseobacterium bernardetii]|uniref:Uncharacterized protein n=1 Tax=Chryseobacterium bernardetii TaxID=1241978 RepID=A0A3G6T2A1_9FLAO|nr:hypothetical protein EG339_02060 [Chryseobacterium bernardetii]